MARTKAGDIDAIRSAIRPRLAKLQAGGGAPIPTLKPHTHSADQITSEPAGNIAAANVQAALEELDLEKLARDGSQPMLGALDMNHFDLNNVNNAEVEVDLVVGNDATVGNDVTVGQDVTVARDVNVGQDANVTRDVHVGQDVTVARDVLMTGGVGAAIIAEPRVLHMVGDAADDEAKIDGLKRVVFNPQVDACRIEQPSIVEFNELVQAGTDTTPKRGQVGFDRRERLPYTWFQSISSTDSRLHKIPWGWNVLQCVRGESGGGTNLPEGSVVVSFDAVDYEGDGEPLHRVNPHPGGEDASAFTWTHKVVGLTLGAAAHHELVAVMQRGRWHTASRGWAVGDQVWADGSDLRNSIPTSGGVRIFIGTVFYDDTGGMIVDVNVRVMPLLVELSFVNTVPPAEFFVPVFHEVDGQFNPEVLAALGVSYDPSLTGIPAVNLQEALDYLTQREGARVFNSADVPIASGVASAIPFDSDRYNLFAMHDTATDNSRITITKAGRYSIGGCVQFAAQAGGVRALSLVINGADTIAATNRAAIGTVVDQLAIQTDYEFAAGEYVELVASQDSGVSVDVEASAALSPEFWCNRLAN